MNLSEKMGSSVKLGDLYFEKIEFWRSGRAVEEGDLAVRFSKSYGFNKSRTSCDVGLGCVIRDPEEQVMRLEVLVKGHFTCEDAVPERREILLTKNTLAILFPYLRSEISILTAQPDLSPLVLPPLNMETVFDEAEQTQ